ncbi:MAG: acyltransferase family protein [Candidatus Hermodarchaeota archaeon]
MKDRKTDTKVVLVETEKDFLEESRERFFQVDVLKAIMIFLVIFDHMVSWEVKREIGVSLWERISIPVFLVIMGFNMGISFQKKGVQSLKELYSWSYFKSKILRYILPFLVLYAASTFIGLFMYGFDLSAMYHGQNYPDRGFILLFIGFLPFWGPGNWFLPVIFGSILIFPLLYWAFTKKPILTLILCFAVEIIMQLIVFFVIGQITTWEEAHYYNLFATSVLFYLSAIGLGLWFSFNRKPFSRRNLFIWILFPISLTYMIFYQFFDFRFRIGDVPLFRGDYLFLIFPYSAFLFLLAMRFLPQKSEGGISRAISLIGKSTYHILLTQILGYGMIYAFWGTHYGITAGFGPEKIIDMIVLWIFFISFGILWYKIDQNKDLRRRALYYINFFIVFASLLLLTFWVQEFWVPIPLLIIIIYAIVALITKFIIKKPLQTGSLSLWTIFLMMAFIMMILQVEIFQPKRVWITFIPIAITLSLAIVGTYLDYKLS